jgi:hypothetical protein
MKKMPDYHEFREVATNAVEAESLAKEGRPFVWDGFRLSFNKPDYERLAKQYSLETTFVRPHERAYFWKAKAN